MVAVCSTCMFTQQSSLIFLFLLLLGLAHALGELGEGTTAVHQVIERVCLDDLAALDDCEARAVLHGRESMSNDNRGAVTHDGLERIIDKSLRGLIQSTGSFV